MLIGELSRRSGFSRDTIRYYEKLRLLAAAPRNAGNNYKDYGREALDRLTHIRRLKGIGFTLREIRDLLRGVGTPHPCKDLPHQLARKCDAIDKRVAALLEIKASLLDVRGACDGACEAPNGMPTCVTETNPPRKKTKCC